MTAEALGRLVAAVGPHLRQLSTEVEKLVLFAGDRAEITADDVAGSCPAANTPRPLGWARRWATAICPRALRALDEDLWEIKLKVDRTRATSDCSTG